MATKKRRSPKKKGGAKPGCAAKKARIAKAKTPKARGQALAAYMKAGCAPKRKKRKSTRKRGKRR